MSLRVTKAVHTLSKLIVISRVYESEDLRYIFAKGISTYECMTKLCFECLLFFFIEFKSGRKRLQCLCTTCREKKTCTTNGSCLVFRNPADGEHVKRCIVEGEDKELICSNVLLHKQDVRCCETDFCNRRLGKISAC